MDSKIIANLVRKSTSQWAKQRKAEERNQTQVARRRDSLIKSYRITIKEAAWSVMREAYMKVSANNSLPAAARQIMYAARGRIQEMTEKQLDDKYFTQTLLPDYMSSNPDETANWDVVFDARGNIYEPHTESKIPLGTLSVRKYLNDIRYHTVMDFSVPALDESLFPSCGPENRFGAILFIEKEGFMPLFNKVQLADRYDIAIMSTKGLSVIAARRLVDQHSEESSGIALLIVRDFDKAGFSIAGTLQRDTRRFEFKNYITAIDLGLRLNDVNQFNLESEFVSYGKTDPTRNLRENGATDEEIEFLCTNNDWRGASGNRVELNAFTSDQLITWIEGKLKANHIQKVIPKKNELEKAYRRALVRRYFQNVIDAAESEAEKINEGAKIPENLEQQIAKWLEEYPEKSWDRAIEQLLVE